MFFILFWVSVLTHLLIYAVPGNPADIIAERRYGDAVTRDLVESVERELGFDRPLAIQYVRWVQGAVQGRFGYSFRTGEPVVREVVTRARSTMELASSAFLVSVLIAVPSGILSAVKPNSAVDGLVRVTALFGVSIPNFWLGLVLILVFSLHFGLFPVYGEGLAAHLVLPAITLGTSLAAITTRLIRSSMLAVLSKDYVTYARAKGLPYNRVVLRHVLKNALIPVITVGGLQLGSLLAGTVIIEVIFARRGVGRLLYDSIFARDIPVIQCCVLLFTMIHMMVNLLVDLTYSYLNPTIRYGDKP